MYRSTRECLQLFLVSLGKSPVQLDVSAVLPTLPPYPGPPPITPQFLSEFRDILRWNKLVVLGMQKQDLNTLSPRQLIAPA